MKLFPCGKYEALLRCMKRDPKGSHVFFATTGKKNPGIELLSHTQLCSTIVARPLINRVRDGNVSFKPAIDTGKKYVIKIAVILEILREEAKQLLTTRVEF